MQRHRMARPPAAPLPLTKKERSSLAGITASVSLPHRAVREARDLLMAGDGIANMVIAETLGVSRSTVNQWREHFEIDGVSWVGKVREGRGRKPVITAETSKHDRRGGLRYEPTTQRHGVVLRRAFADPCTGSHPTQPADEAGSARGGDPRLRALSVRMT